MKLFSAKSESSIKELSKSAKKVKGSLKELNSKEKPSNGEIRDKVAAHVELSNEAKVKSREKIKSSPELGSGYMNSEVKKIEPSPLLKVESENETSFKSDVQVNDPEDTNTQEKLKASLRNGAFSFNSKEKEALEKILSVKK